MNALQAPVRCVVEADRREVARVAGDSKTVTTLTVIAPSRRRPGIPSRNASSGIASSLRPGAVTSPARQRREAVAQGVEQLAEVEQLLDLGAAEYE